MPDLLRLTADQHDWPPWTTDNFLHDLPEKWLLSFISNSGIAIVSRLESDHVHLHLLAIAPDMRSQGIGSRFMSELLRRAGDDHLTLKVPRDNAGAIKFYHRHGFIFEMPDSAARWRPMFYLR